MKVQGKNRTLAQFLYFREKRNWSSRCVQGVGGWVWVYNIGGWMRGMMWDREFSEKFSRKFRKISEKFPLKCSVIRKREIEFVNRKIKIFTKGLQKNNPEIMLSSPVKYLQKCKNRPSARFLPCTFNNVMSTMITLLYHTCFRKYVTIT